MFDWFEKLVRETIWRALNDFFSDLTGLIEEKIREKLKSLTAGQQLSTTPLIRVTGVDEAADTVQILIRGAFPFESLTPFMRLEVAVSRSDIDLSFASAPIKIKRWIELLGELRVTKEKAFDGDLGFGYDKGAWAGQGSLKLLPLQIGAAIYGGLSDRGMVLGLDAQLPPAAALPLGPTGLGLRGIGGDFAYNFVARLEKDGAPVPNPAAKDYVTWAKNTNVDRWQPGPIDKTAVGVGIRTVICTLADQGFVFELNPVGFSFLVPGGAIILGGKGVLLRRKGFGVEGYFVIDVASASLALGAGVNVEIKAPPEELADGGFATLLKGFGQLDAFFSFSDPTAWFFDLGTEAKPCYLEVLTDVPVISILFSEKAEAYLRINHHRVAFGAKIGIGGEYKLGIIHLIARLAVALAAYIGWDPMLVRAQLSVLGELGIKVWKFSFLIKGEATPKVYLPHPTLFSFELKFTLDLPWPIPDIEGSKKFGDDIAEAPKISSPLRAGEAVAGGFTTTLDQRITAIHVISDVKWNLDVDKPWPDLELVVPFQARVTDGTGAIIGLPVSPVNQSGYNVEHKLTKLELFDLEHNAILPNVKGIWAVGPGGDNTQLHVLGTDPFAWLTADVNIAVSASSTPSKVVEAFFGYGLKEIIVADRAFGDLHVVPMAPPAILDPGFAPGVPTRVLRGNHIELRFKDAAGKATPVDEIVLFLISANERIHGEPLKTSPVANVTAVLPLGQLYGSLSLVGQYFGFSTPVTSFQFASSAAGGKELLVYAVRYREARQTASSKIEKMVLTPGRYRLTVEGKSTAVHEEFSAHPDIYPSAPEIDWHATQEFEVTYPASTRAYTYYTTLGDNRLFAKQQHPWTTWTAAGWDPTLYGIGFPLYRHYRIVVRFLVSYIGEIFTAAPLKLRLGYEAGGEIIETIAPTATPDGSSSKLPQSQDWITANGGTVPPDAELVMSALAPKAGMCTLDVVLAHPAQGDIKLDEWTGYVSNFDDFRSHLAWPVSCLTVRYDASGRHVDPTCPTIHTPWHPWDVPLYGKAIGIDSLPKPVAKLVVPWAADPLLPIVGVLHPEEPYPTELTSPPLAWRLPSNLAGELGPLDAQAALRFARFAAASGARFGDAADPLVGVDDPVLATTIEAVVDSANRPYALWMRTPEPVDWRRVTIALTISHVTPASGCPSGYAHRHELELAVGVLPNADGSGAFLTGSLAGVATRLPRGEYLLTLSFDPTAPGLPGLRPSVLVGAGPEVVKLRFIQPYGLDWPLPSSHGGIRLDLVELAMKYVLFDPHIWEEAVVNDWPAERIEAALAASAKAKEGGRP
jgi:hypothetical protein